MIKAIFLDIDGTLLSHKSHRIPPSAIEGLALARQKGIKVVIATGRHAMELDVLDVPGLEYDGCIILNGQVCMDENGEIFSERPITGPDLENLISIYEGDQIPVVLIGKDGLHLNFADENVSKVQAEIKTPLPGIRTWKGQEIYMASVYGPREKDTELAAHFAGLKLARWNPLAADLIPEDAGKVKGVEQFLNRFGISREEIMAFGDEENDIDMIRFAKIGVVLGNGGEAAKKAADYVTEDIDRDGVFLALKHFGII